MEKDVYDYGGITSYKTQVKDLWAGRLTPTAEDPSKQDDMKNDAIRILNNAFKDHPNITMNIEQKILKIDYKGEIHVIKAKYITFNNHIELQIVTTRENDMMMETHKTYNERRVGNSHQVIDILPVTA